MSGRDTVPPHASLLLALARPTLDPDRLLAIRALAAREDLDWGAFLHAAARHKVLPLIGRHVDRYRLDRGPGEEKGFPHPWAFTSSYLGNRSRNQALSDEFGRLLTELTSAGVRHAVRKGFHIAETVYHDIGVRRIGDLDLLVDPAGAPEAHQVFLRLGYVRGRLAFDGERIVPALDGEESDQLPYLKAGNRPDVPEFHVDVCQGIQLKAGCTVTASELLERSVPVHVCGTGTRAADPADRLLDLASLIHAETIGLRSIDDRVDLQVSKFMDLALVAAQFEEADWQDLGARVREYDVAATAYYALHFTDVLHPGVIPGGVLDLLRPRDTGYLEEYGSLDGRTARWTIPFPQRLFVA
ncbi:nucleotidyltransferase family protein [Streptomyces sp. NPDC058401]|uniref:nucleotidyltransferase family protein n=1 Tax=Streptomyces sp. NPDC058401 TaxID=3346480 RepID=UPI003666ECD2